MQKTPRGEFDRLVDQHGVQRNTKGFSSWDQFVAMLFCHLARADSLREICYGLSCCNGKLNHLGVSDGGPKRSTLSYANAHRSADFFHGLFWAVLDHYRATQPLNLRNKHFRFKNKLMSLDSTTVTLCG